MPTKVLSNKLPWITSCVLLLAVPIPAKAFSVNLDTFTPITNALGEPSEVFNSVPSTATINERPINEGGFGNFFQDSSFLLLGANPNQTIFNDNHTVGISAVLSNDIEILAENADRDLDINLDWTFQGNSDGILSGTNLDDLDTFSLAIVGADVGSLENPVELELFATTQYQEQRDYKITIPGGLSTGTYNVLATVVEPSLDIPLLSNDSVFTEDTPLAAGPNDNSAAGIGDMNITLSSDVNSSSVPFEFTPTTGLFIVGSIWGLLRWQKRKNLVGNNELKS